MKILYLRTLARFNLTSGGSVGHTSGVINAMSKIADLDVVSNDKLTGVNYPIKIYKPFLKFLPVFGEFMFNIRLIFTLKNIKSYSFIYQRHTNESFLGAYYRKKYDVPFILEYNCSEVWTLQNWHKNHNIFLSFLIKIYRNVFKIPLAKTVENYNLKYASYIVVVSDVLKTELLGRGIPEKKIIVNPNGVDIDKYNPNIDNIEVVSKYNLEGKKVIGFIGTFGQWHGGLVMAEAINVFLKKYEKYKENCVFLLIGDGNQLAQVREMVKTATEAGNVIFTGKIIQSLGANYLSSCKILLSPHIPNPDGTEFFGSPTKLFEYMAMGKAIVASDLNQIGKILENEKTALLVEPNNPEQIADSINRLLEDKRLAMKLGENARAAAVDKFSWDKHVNNIFNYIDENK